MNLILWALFIHKPERIWETSVRTDNTVFWCVSGRQFRCCNVANCNTFSISALAFHDSSRDINAKTSEGDKHAVREPEALDFQFKLGRQKRKEKDLLFPNWRSRVYERGDAEDGTPCHNSADSHMRRWRLQIHDEKITRN